MLSNRPGRKLLIAMSATAVATIVTLVAGVTPAQAGSQSWGSKNCGSKYVYAQTFSAGYTYHQHQIVGHTTSREWSVPQSGGWRTSQTAWHSVVNSYVSADVLQSASRGCASIIP